jgi:site-specific DNA recombinase
MKKKVIIYVRVSTTRQKQEGFSIESQKKKIIQFCNAANYEVVAIFEEDFFAKDLMSRPQYQQLKNFVKNSEEKISNVFVLRWDRLCRNQSEALNEIKWFKDFGIEVNAIEQWIDLSVPEAKILLSIYTATPNEETDKVSVEESERQGESTLAPKGYKYQLDQVSKKMQLLLDEPDASFVKEALKKSAACEGDSDSSPTSA